MTEKYKKKGLAIFVGVTFLLLSLVSVWSVKLGGSTPNGLGFNTSSTYIPKGDIFRTYVEWNESVNGSIISFNYSHSDVLNLKKYVFDSTNEPTSPYLSNETFNSNWTNYTLNTTGWSIGNHLIMVNVTSTNESGSADNYTEMNITLWDSTWSTNHEFASSPSINLNWTNNNQQDISLGVSAVANSSHKINIDNKTTGISGNYSQYDFYDSLSYSHYAVGGIGSGKCFIPDDTNQNNPLLVKNSAGTAKNTTSLMSAGDQKNYTLIHKVICPPGRYWGIVELRNATNTTEALNITAEINVPISTENELDNVTGIGFFNGSMPENASTYHSYYFNTSNSSNVGSIPNATGVKIELKNLARDLDLFLLDESGNLKAKSIEKGSNSESLTYNYLPDGEMWEIRTYGNHTQKTNYGGVLHFTTLNATNSSDNSTLSNVDFGDMWPGNQTRVNVTLKNEGSLNFTEVGEGSKRLYHREIFGGASAPNNFTFFVPLSATKVEVSANWTGSSRYNLSLYKPNGSLVNYSSNKRGIANVTGVEQEEWVEASPIPEEIPGNQGFWKVRIANETNVSFNSYNIIVKVWFDADDWIKTNYTTQNFKELGIANNSQSYHFNFTVQNNSLAGKYKGWLEYQSDSGTALRVPLEFNLTAPEMVVETSWEVGEGSVMVEDNIGFNRSGANKLQIVRMINNTGNKNLTFDPDSNSTFLNDSSNNYMNFTYSYPDYINPGDYGNLTINITIDTTKTNNNAGLYKGWILLNASEAQPDPTFNLTVNVNLADRLNVTWVKSKAGDGLATKSGNDNWIENVSRDENITLFAKVFYKNGTPLGDNVLKRDGFSAWIKERNVSSSRVPSFGSLDIYNDSSGDDVWDTNGYYDPNVSIPVSSQSIPGGYYNVYLKTNHSVNGVELNGTAVHNHLVVNNTGLDLSAVTGKSFSFNEGDSPDYMNVTVVNYGPQKATGKLYMDTWSYAGITAYGTNESGNDCGSVSSSNYFTLHVNANATEACEFSWKIDPDNNVSSDQSTSSLKIYPTDSHFNNITGISISVDDTDTTDGGTNGGAGGQCTYTDWTNQSCGGGTCSATAMYQTKALSSGPDACTDPKERCIEALQKCGSKDISLSLENETVKIVQGGSGSNKLTANNTGDLNLTSLKLGLEGIEGNWYEIPSDAISLNTDEEKDITVNFSIPENASVDTYLLTYKISNDDVSASVNGNLDVLPSEETKVDINETFEEVKTNFTDLENRFNALKGYDTNLTGINETLSELRDKLESAEKHIENGNYLEAKKALDSAKSLYADAKKSLEEKEEKEPDYLLWIIAGVIVIILVAILVYLLLPPKQGYHPQKGFEYKPPKRENIFDKVKKELEDIIDKIKNKFGSNQNYKFKGK